MRNIDNYYGNIDLFMDGYIVKPCISKRIKDRHYIVYKPNYEYWKDEVEHENELRVLASDDFIHEWIPVCKIYGYTDKFFELDEINYLVQKWHRWKIMAGKSGICLIDDNYRNPNEEPVTPVAWMIDFNNLTEDQNYEPHKNGYKLMDVDYQ